MARSESGTDSTKVAKARTAERFLQMTFPPKEPLVQDLVHRRDLVALGARRRHGKTSLITNLGVALAAPVDDFLGYKIPKPRRSLLLMLEDDPGEYQEKLKRVVGQLDTQGRISIITRDDFYESGIPIDVREQAFKESVLYWAEKHKPDLIAIDNLAHVIDAEYSDPKRVHELMKFCYALARDNNAAVILAAHPKKDNDEAPVSLEDDPGRFFESIMGSSHFINSTGSLWGLERRDADGDGYSVFVGGRQRGEGHQCVSHLYMDDQDWFQLIPEVQHNLKLVLNTQVREKAWNLLPDPPRTFGYREAEERVRSVMRSTSTFNKWMRECRRLKVVVDAPGGGLCKALEQPAAAQWPHAAAA